MSLNHINLVYCFQFSLLLNNNHVHLHKQSPHLIFQHILHRRGNQNSIENFCLANSQCTLMVLCCCIDKSNLRKRIAEKRGPIITIYSYLWIRVAKQPPGRPHTQSAKSTHHPSHPSTIYTVLAAILLQLGFPLAQYDIFLRVQHNNFVNIVMTTPLLPRMLYFVNIFKALTQHSDASCHQNLRLCQLENHRIYQKSLPSPRTIHIYRTRICSKGLFLLSFFFLS